MYYIYKHRVYHKHVDPTTYKHCTGCAFLGKPEPCESARLQHGCVSGDLNATWQPLPLLVLEHHDPHFWYIQKQHTLPQYWCSKLQAFTPLVLHNPHAQLSHPELLIELPKAATYTAPTRENPSTNPSLPSK